MLTTLQLLAVFAFIPAAVIAGRRLGKSPAWPVGFIAPFAVIALIILGHRSTTLSFLPPISWAIHPYIFPPLMALAIPLMLTTLLVRIPVKRTRIVVAILMAAMIIYYALLPIALPLAVRSTLAATPTKINHQNVCLQTHAYTCGPAAAVTCLRALHIPAEEGLLAIEAHAGPAVGTDPILLEIAINHLAEPRRLQCRYENLQQLDHLTTPAVANIFSPRYGGHYVAVLAITPTGVVIADPLSGKDTWTREEFLAQWSGAAHVFSALPDSPASHPGH